MKVPFVVPHRSLPWPPGRVVWIMAVRRTRAKLLSRSGPDGRLWCSRGPMGGCGEAQECSDSRGFQRTRLGSKVASYVVMAGGIVTSSPVPPSATLAPSPHPACAWPHAYGPTTAWQHGEIVRRGGGAANIRDSRVQGKPRAARSLTSILINPINLVRQGW